MSKEVIDVVPLPAERGTGFKEGHSTLAPRKATGKPASVTDGLTPPPVLVSSEDLVDDRALDIRNKVATFQNKIHDPDNLDSSVNWLIDEHDEEVLCMYANAMSYCLELQKRVKKAKGFDLKAKLSRELRDATKHMLSLASTLQILPRDRTKLKLSMGANNAVTVMARALNRQVDLNEKRESEYESRIKRRVV